MADVFRKWRIRRLVRRIERLRSYRETFEWHLPPSWMATTAKIETAERKLALLLTAPAPVETQEGDR